MTKALIDYFHYILCWKKGVFCIFFFLKLQDFFLQKACFVPDGGVGSKLKKCLNAKASQYCALRV